MQYEHYRDSDVWVKKDRDGRQAEPTREGSSGNPDLAMVMSGINDLRAQMDHQSQQNHYLYTYLQDMRDKLRLEPYPHPYPFPPPSPPHT